MERSSVVVLDLFQGDRILGTELAIPRHERHALAQGLASVLVRSTEA
jgi:hypothetical protein